MYKLVAVAGKMRGNEFELEDGENVVGRGDECGVVIPINGISKRHLSITVTRDVAYLKDLGSSNGTFLNGKITKSATIKDKDKIALPDLILQVVHVKEKKVVIKKKVSTAQEEEEHFLKPKEQPRNLADRVLHLFKFKFMPIIHGINQEYEWRVLFGIFCAIFVVANVTLTILPILQDSKKILLSEVAKRGGQYADEISRTNFRALEQGKLDQVNTAFLEKDESIEGYELFDLEGRIVMPISKRNEYISDPYSVRVLNWSKKNQNTEDAIKSRIDGGKIGIGKNILAFNPRTGSTEPVGVIAIKFAPKSLMLEASNSSKAYMESIITSALVAILFFGIVYYLTLRPLEEIKYQMEEAVRGKRRSVEGDLLFSELAFLKDGVNGLIQRWREASQTEEDSEFMEAESDDLYVTQLSEFMMGSGVPAIVLNSNKELMKANLQAEDVTGIRENASIGMSLLDCAREKGFAATVIELCEASGDNAGTNQQGTYELQGHDYTIHVVSLMGKDNYAKAFYATFIKDE